MKTAEDRFESYVERIPESGCWIWMGSNTGPGYGRFWADGRLQIAHRYSYRKAFGETPTGLSVCHRCDVPACVRPDHLFLGTHRQNMEDMARKGRQARQSRVGTSKLTPGQVLAIRSDPRPNREIAADYDVDRSSIYQIKSGRCWSSLPNNIIPESDHG